MKSLPTLVILSLTLALAGCTEQPATTGPETSPPPPTVDTHAEHGHASEGPHHGDLIELGNEDFHAELLHDEAAGTVTIYVLDGSATKQVPIDASEVTINATIDGQPQQFALAASPDSADPSGQSSRFVSEDEELAAHLDDDGAHPKLVLTIAGKSYRGEIAHDHDHEH